MPIPLKKKREVRVTEYYCNECGEWLRANQTWVCEACRRRFCDYDERGVIADREELCYLCEDCYNEECGVKKPKKNRKKVRK